MGMDLDPRDYDDPRDEVRREGTADREDIDLPRARRAPSASADRDGDWHHSDTRSRYRENDDARTLGRGLAMIARPPMTTPLTNVTTGMGQNATATLGSATAMCRMPSIDTSGCRVDPSESSFATAVVSTPSAGRTRARSRQSARSEWSPVVIFATTTAVAPTLVRATSVTCVNKGWS